MQHVQMDGKEGEMTSQHKRRQQDYWKNLKSFLERNNERVLKCYPPAKREFQFTRTGRNSKIYGVVYNRESRVDNQIPVPSIAVFLETSTSIFNHLETIKSTIDNELGVNCEWGLHGYNALKKATIRQQGLNFAETKDWPTMNLWFEEQLISFERVFTNRLSGIE